MSLGRIVCIAFPYAVTVGALVSLIFVGIGSTNSKSSTDNDLYFFRADLSNLTISGTSLLSAAESALSDLTSRSDADSALESALTDAVGKSNIRDFYDIGLWGYCSGNKTSDGKYVVDYCTKPKAEYAFDPVEVWGLNSSSADSAIDDILPTSLKDALSTYKAVSKWMFIAYIIAFAATALELIVGIFAICSRMGSFITSLISGVAFLFTAAASITATALFAVYTGVFNSDLKQYDIHGSMGKNIFVATWFATAFAFAGIFFWLMSSCCCAARSPYHGNHRRNRVMAEKAPYTYERVSTPYGNSPYIGGSAPAPAPVDPYTQHHNVPMQPYRSDAYEPFRHV
ncbi:hypothetical protein UA08_08198 [Talaromyces atroroseus]|uniref:SUR7 family protein pun1 n=1 Tax=Talaromyces atroroseus TaxID=1441469 RepID=A0A225AF16_TALAT|nr:hypothetical protein UA08_08198 [Talaromyces atroroseus]OKL56634.1 hypothetical protein UA08_08198 [Talaromyces atroroseus]